MELNDNGTEFVHPEYEYDGNFTQPWDWDFKDYVSWVLHSVLDGLATALGLLANGLLLVLFTKAPPLRTVSNMFLLQRAVADILFLMVVPFFIYDRVNYYYQLASVLCTSLTIAMHGAVLASNVFLMLFTVDSYLVSRSLQCTLRRKVMQITSTVSWLLGVVGGVAVFLFYNHHYHQYCFFYKIYFTHVHDIIIHFVVPVVVVWVLVGITLCSIPCESSSESKVDVGCGNPNRLLLLTISSTFTVLRVLFLFGPVAQYGLLYIDKVIMVIISSLPTIEKVLNPILVICLTEGLRQKVDGWLPGRHSSTVPLQDP